MRALLMLTLVVTLLLLAACNRDKTSEPAAGEPSVATVVPSTEAADSTKPDATEAPATEADVSATPDADSDATTSADEDPAIPTDEDAAEAAPTPDVNRGNVVLWHSYAQADNDALAQILARLEEMYPDLNVDTLFVAYDDLPQAYADAVLAGGGPDLIAAPTWWLNEMIDADVVQSLDGMADPAMSDEYWPAALENLQRDDQLYGLPLTYQLVSLFVNTGLAAADEAPQTTDEMLSLAQSSPEKGVGLYANLYHLFWGIPAYGGELIDDQGVVVLDQGDGAAEFFGWLDTIQDAPGTFADLDYGMLMDRFKKGEFAYFVDGPWAIDELSEALGDNLAVVGLPAGPVGPAEPWLSTEAVMINPTLDEAQTQRALLIARGLSDAAAGNIWATVARRLPAARDADVGENALLLGFQQQAATARPMPTMDEMAAVWGYGGDMILKVLNDLDDDDDDGNDVMTPAEAITEASALINEANGK